MKMNRLFFGFFFLTIFFSAADAQEYFVPVNIKSAYEQNSRDYSGSPGENYFQNYSKYTIRADFDADKGVLKGTEKVWYINNSNDSLYYIVIRLYHDILKQGNYRSEEVPVQDLTKGVDIQSLVIENNEYIENPDVFFSRKGTNLIVSLPGLLLPSDSIEISIKWQTQLPQGHLHRFGHYGQSNWFIAYWYPQIAVYDDIDGWDHLDYTGTTELYNDFADFDVEISLTGKHLLWATGDFLNPGQIFSKEILKRYSDSRSKEGLVHVIEQEDWELGNIFLKSGKNKYKFSVKNVTDFTFAVSGNYLWDAQSSKLDEGKSKIVTVNAVYPQGADNFDEIATFGTMVIKDFYQNSLKIAYPFRQVTIFNGDGGMEFPMMVNQRASSKEENNFIVMHEIFHAYFPFMTGLNERKFAWLDEGLTTYLPIITEEKLGGHFYNMPKINYNYYQLAGVDVEAPLMFPSHLLSGFPYHHHAYFRSSVALFVLEDYLGRDNFRKAIKTFIERWKGKHPTGYDFLYTLEAEAGESLHWLVQPWFFEKGFADLELTGATQEAGEKLKLEITNIGGFPVPVFITVEQKDGILVNKKLSSSVWKDNPKTVHIVVDGINEYKKISIGNPNVPDIDKSNNTIKSE